MPSAKPVEPTPMDRVAWMSRTVMPEVAPVMLAPLTRVMPPLIAIGPFRCVAVFETRLVPTVHVPVTVRLPAMVALENTAEVFAVRGKQPTATENVGATPPGQKIGPTALPISTAESVEPFTTPEPVAVVPTSLRRQPVTEMSSTFVRMPYCWNVELKFCEVTPSMIALPAWMLIPAKLSTPVPARPLLM